MEHFICPRFSFLGQLQSSKTIINSSHLNSNIPTTLVYGLCDFSPLDFGTVSTVWHFFSRFWDCFDSVVFFVFHFITNVMPAMAPIGNLYIGPSGQARKAYEFEQFSSIPLLFMLPNI